MANFEAGPVPRDALAYFRGKDLRVGFDYRDVWGQEHAHAFTVAKAMKLDILDDIRAGLDEALAEGKTFREFSRDLKPRLQAKGWWGVKEEIDPETGERREVQLGSPRRLKTIYQSNLRSARAAGQWQRIQRTKEGQPFLLYELGPSENHRDEHVSWAGTLLPVDHPWWRDHMPPNGYGCKCRVRQVSQVEAERLDREGVQDPRAEIETDPETGLPTGRRQRRAAPVRREPPPTRTVSFTNRRTGEITQVDQGLHPAWATNPGQDRVRVLRDRLAGKLDTVDQRLAQATTRDVMGSPVLDAWVNRPDGELPAGVVPRQAQSALSASTQVVRLSPDTFNKQAQQHADLTVADYRQLPDILAGGMLVEQDARTVVSFRRRDGDSRNRWWKVAFKRTGDSDRLYLVSFQKADDRELRRLQRQGKVIRNEQ
ncbi:phage head morphogenesis protein [Marinobacter subterrani]|uniref:Phage Mu protein F like protein n=1 Tax=Marinobacter subterrani TaxID=1658765 RepID=A0A0J7J7X0_9GAMM|nr:phage minor head protein [Marinobacter subterrani]KMQ74011.1 Phage Mu protein F like protein [Marinobacter subterrani]